MLTTISIIYLCIGLTSALIIAIDIARHPQKEMPIMNIVWPVNGLWGGPLCIWAYYTIGKHRHMDMKNMDMKNMDMKNMDMKNMDMKNMDMKNMPEKKYDKYWQGIVADTLHCGAGCSLADLIGPWLILVIPIAVFKHPIFNEWILDYLLALIIGVTFQYAAIAPMLHQKGIKVWWRALKIDFFSLTAWQVGMYGWMAIARFCLVGQMTPYMPHFWFMMQIAMLCGFITAYPVNWLLVKKKVKMGM